MPHVLSDGKGQKIACYSSCVDITYAQAELLLMAEQAKKDHADAFVVGFADSRMLVTSERFLEPHRQFPDGLKKIEAFRQEIKSKGFQSFVIREYLDDFNSFTKFKPLLQIGKSVDTLIDQFADFKQAGDASDVNVMVEDIYANPLHAGVHSQFPASVQDETWISDASRSMKRISVEKWLKRLLLVLRFYFKGQPIIPLPHKNDRCPCGSSKKYGRCCGMGVEHEDPEDCKLGKHEFSSWSPVNDKMVRSCYKCYRVYEAPWFEKTEFENIQITVIGCRACGLKPTPEEIHNEIVDTHRFHICAYCGKPFTLSSMVFEHLWEDGKHMDQWTVTDMAQLEGSISIDSMSLGENGFLHRECFTKALPAWPKLMKKTTQISRDTTEAPSS
jgi:uncharacterized CHY-type Zn-finger protein